MLQIAVINESTAEPDAAISHMLKAFQTQWNRDLSKVWSTPQAEFKFIAKGERPRPDAWWLVFLDNSDQADALAYHDLTSSGLPLSKVFVKTIAEDGASLSVGATHELCEMAVDPWLNSASQDPHGVFWATEICDPVEDDQYGYQIDGVLVSDFVTPDWFAHQFSQRSVDHKEHAMKAFEVLSGGYAQYFDSHQGWVQVTGSKAQHSARARPPVGSRRERRMRGSRTFQRSEPAWSLRDR